MMKSKIKCDCGNLATWIYMPTNDMKHPFWCDDCVNRGCSCNYMHVGPGNDYADGYPDLSEDGKEGVNWKWVEKNKTWVHLDEKGREWPCCEYDFDEEGYDEDWLE